MKEKKKSAAGRLFYTFGTVLLLSVVAVCVINYSRDGRAFQIPLLRTVAETSADQSSTNAAKGAEEFQTIKYQKPEAKAASKSSSKETKASGTKPAEKATPAPAPKKPQPAADP